MYKKPKGGRRSGLGPAQMRTRRHRPCNHLFLEPKHRLLKRERRAVAAEDPTSS